MTDFTYTFLSLRDEKVIEEIPLYGVYAQRILCSPGQFNGTFNLDQTGKRNQDLVDATIPGRTWLVMEREGVPVWWGIVWSRNFQSQAKSVQIYGAGFEVYPSKQLMLSNFTRLATNQLDIFCDLWTEMQGVSGRNLNINIPTGNPATVTKDLTVSLTDRKYYIEPMNALANAIDGFDWTITVTRDGTGYRKDLVLGYPYLGVNTSADSLTFDYPGNILNYYQTESMADAGTHTFGYGAGEGESQLVASAEFNDMVLGEGWPRWDAEVSLKDIDNFDNLQQVTLQQGIKNKPPMNTYTVTLKGNLEPIIGSYTLGDACTLSLHDSKHPEIFEIDTRVVGYEITPQSSDSTEEVKLIIPGDSVNDKKPTAGL